MKEPLYMAKVGLAFEGPKKRPEHEYPKKRHLHLVPHHDDRSRPKRPRATVVIAIVSVLAVIATGLAVYAWQHGGVADQQRAAATSTATLRSQLTAEQARVAALTSRVVAAHKALAAAQGHSAALHQRLTDLQDQLRSATVATTAAENQLAQVAGPPTADGRYLVFIKAVGATQTPPLVVADVAQWFDGKAADRAAQDDGVIPAGESVPNDYYIRNASPAWRTLPVATQPRVSMLTWHDGALGFHRVTLGRLQTVFTTPNARQAGLNLSPFWIRITGGEVTGIHQQYTP